MEEPHAHWMFVTDSLRGYVTRRGFANIPPHGRTEIIEVIVREIASTRSLMDVASAAQKEGIYGEIEGAAHFLHALRQADEALPRAR